MAKVRRRRSQWVDLIAQYESSGMSYRAFCQSQGLQLSSFKSWRYLLNKEKRKPVESPDIKMLHVSVAKVPVEQSLLRFCFPNGLELKIDVGTSPSYVAILIQALC